MPAMDAVLTTTPRWPSSSGSFSPMAAAARRVTLKVPYTFISMVWVNGSMGCGTPPRATVAAPTTAVTVDAPSVTTDGHVDGGADGGAS